MAEPGLGCVRIISLLWMRTCKIVLVQQVVNFCGQESNRGYKVTEDIDFLARIKTIDYSGRLLFVSVCLIIRLVCVGEDNVGSES